MQPQENISELNEREYLACEKRWVFLLLMLVAGFFGGFTFLIRGGVFCNAQTANLVLLALSAAEGNWSRALYLLMPVSAYILGAFVSEYVPLAIKRKLLLRWETLFIALETGAVIFLALLPETAPHQISQVIINFICSMQYNTFRQAESVPMATTFCTNHVRQVGVALSNLLRHREKAPHASKLAQHGAMLAAFILGAFSAAVLTRVFLGKAMFFAVIPLAVILANLLRADLKTEKGLVHRKPHGH